MPERTFVGQRLGPNEIVIAGPDFTNDRLGDFHYSVQLPIQEDVSAREPNLDYLRRLSALLRGREYETE